MPTSTNTITQNKSMAAYIDDFKQITKFGLSLSVVFSAVAGYLIAADSVQLNILIALALGGYCMVGASNVFNQVIERDTDKLMKRTQNRPLPAGRMTVSTAMIIGVILAILGIGILYNINAKTALFGAVSIFLYVSVYTPLKPVTPLAVFVGAIPGAIPFMLGWVAATGTFGIEAGFLFLIQFFWQFPHFWAIGWLQHDEYKKAGFEMLPTGEKNKKATTQILLYTIWMIIASIIPVFGMTGELKLSIVGAIFVFALGVLMLIAGWKLHKKQTDALAKKLMLTSVLYITVVQIIFVIDKFI